MNKAYLGDGAYVELDDHTADVVITAEDGIRATDRVVLEDRCLLYLMGYVNKHKPWILETWIKERVEP